MGLRTGVAELPLHYGRAPRWLFNRMVKLSKAIAEVIVDEYGTQELLRRLADPFFFQSLSCALGYDWHSSGTTTVTCAALREALSVEEHGVAVAGGKGKASMRTPEEVVRRGVEMGLSGSSIDRLVYTSRMSAKVDNAVLQDGYTLYHHVIVFDERGRWVVIQQGMNPENRYARRYHWCWDGLESFVVEPHKAIVCDRRMPVVLDMTNRASEGCRRASRDVALEGPRRVARMLKSVRPAWQRSLDEWDPNVRDEGMRIQVLRMPRRLNWDALKRVYELQPRNYEELVAVRGVGPSTVRALALLSQLIYGEPPSWRDPVKYSFTVGGKDGVPYPVRRDVYDSVIQFLRDAIQRAELGDRERLEALRKLSKASLGEYRT